MHRLSIKSSPSIATDPGNESFASAGREKGHPLEAQRHSGGESLQITMRREAESGDERYRIYQLLMQSGLECQERSEVYQHSMEVEVTSAIGETQYKLREVILCYTQYPFLLLIIHNVNCIYALAGSRNMGRAV